MHWKQRKLLIAINNWQTSVKPRIPKLVTILQKITAAAYHGKDMISFPCKQGHEKEIADILVELRVKKFTANYYVISPYGQYVIVVRW